MRVIFRADASLDIGTGHVMRCLTLADALRAQGGQCGFVCRAHSGNLIDLIRARGHEVHALPLLADAGRDCGAGDYASWLGADWATDAQQTAAAVGAATVDWLVVDHYALDARWERVAGAASRHVMVIDDLADRLHDCKLLLDQNLNRKASDYAGLIPAGTDILAGPRYALLRPDFSALRQYSFSRRIQARLDRLMISMGGIDRDNATGQVLDALMSHPLPFACRITVVMGGQAPWLPEVRAKAKQMQAVEILVDVQDMAQLMADSDFAIGAAGTSAWERCCLGLPTLTMVLADNQRGGALALSEAGAVSLLHGGRELPMELNARMTDLSVARTMLDMQEACRAVCDGMGVSRVTEAMSHAN